MMMGLIGATFADNSSSRNSVRMEVENRSAMNSTTTIGLQTHSLTNSWSTEFVTILVIVNIFADFCIVVGNSMVLLVIVRHKRMRTRTNLFLANLAVADLLVGLVVVPFTITTLIEQTWIFGHTVCLMNGWMNSFCLIASFHTLMYISVHKYFSIVSPLREPLTLKYILAMMAAAWLWAAVCSSMNVLGLRVEYKVGTSQCGPRYPHDTTTYLIHGVIQCTCLVIPFCILMFCYVRIFWEIRKLSKRLIDHSSAETQAIIAQEKSVAITMLIVLAIFVIMALPYLVYASYTTVVKDKTHFPSFINPLAYTFLYLSSMCDPIIYAFRSQSFREGYKEILCQPVDYPTADSPHALNKTKRFSTLISVLQLKRGTSSQKQTMKNGDIVVKKGGKIVCIRRAAVEREDNLQKNRSRLPSGVNVNLISERITELDEEKSTGKSLTGAESEETLGEERVSIPKCQSEESLSQAYDNSVASSVSSDVQIQAEDEHVDDNKMSYLENLKMASPKHKFKLSPPLKKAEKKNISPDANSTPGFSSPALVVNQERRSSMCDIWIRAQSVECLDEPVQIFSKFRNTVRNFDRTKHQSEPKPLLVARLKSPIRYTK